MNKILLFLAIGFATGMLSCSQQTLEKTDSLPQTYTISQERLLDKIKGGWAGQTIGVAYGGPTEFRYRSAMIQDYVPISYADGCIKNYFKHAPGLFDDIYMDLTFVEVFDRLGIDAPVDSFAHAFAHADYGLWHANQAARYNILNGIMPPASGHWLNNPHADDIDYQIEADFAGLMTPGMPNTASEISDKIGHIMNYGDGWYGGVYIGAMYSLAFISDDINIVVQEALKTIPENSRFHQCMNDVIQWLYGEGDFYKTMDISTRCGQDSDCNPASAAGILATIQGYSQIPEYWMKNLREVENLNFAYTDMSLNQTYQTSFKHALQMIKRNGGSISGDNITIVCQTPVPVRFEQAFEGMFPIGRQEIRKELRHLGSFTFEGTGIVFTGYIRGAKNYVAQVEMYVDGKIIERAVLPTGKNHRVDLFWKYQLPEGKHIVTFKWLNPDSNAQIHCNDALIYSNRPLPIPHQ